eukprot:TRINITY_DN64013_c0_g1_i1.p1 TRINITY_DN64013_c0_g1~~TRINITY_DN64013_c0_g1_i1.p1  ORF type:complete len:344 (-),score=11.70 TRINITY_DN64013_c0_g1_i1:336-1367(-)
MIRVPVFDISDGRGFVSVPVDAFLAPPEMQLTFDESRFTRFSSDKFRFLSTLEDAGELAHESHVCYDVLNDRLVTVTHIPISLMSTSHKGYLRENPKKRSSPWLDIGCRHFLTNIGCPYVVPLHCIASSQNHLVIVEAYVPGDSLFDWVTDLPEPPCLTREALIKPIAKHMASCLRRLHDMSIVRVDVSCENVLCSDDEFRIKLRRFDGVSTKRTLFGRRACKPSHYAPESFVDDSADGFLTDAFALGVTIYVACFKHYPWNSASPDDRFFQNLLSYGFHAFARLRKLPCNGQTVHDVASDELLNLLSGLLQPNPECRTTLGEDAWTTHDGHRWCIWDEPWLD